MDVFLGHELALANVQLGMPRAGGNAAFTARMGWKLVCHRGNGG